MTCECCGNLNGKCLGCGVLHSPSAGVDRCDSCFDRSPVTWKIDEGSLDVEIDTWDDPGDYPSGAGSGPLPSYTYVDEVSGTLFLERTPPLPPGLPTDKQESLTGEAYDEIHEFLVDEGVDVARGGRGFSVSVTSWFLVQTDKGVEATVKEFENK
jgi:hypothetical protein